MIVSKSCTHIKNDSHVLIIEMEIGLKILESRLINLTARVSAIINYYPFHTAFSRVAPIELAPGLVLPVGIECRGQFSSFVVSSSSAARVVGKSIFILFHIYDLFYNHHNVWKK